MLTLVREFVYLSDRMLRQFAPSHESWWNRIKLKKLAGSIGTSGAKFEFESAGSTGALPIGDLTKVVSYIQESALWYADSSVHPGRWIFFDAPITYWTLDSVANTGSTMFFDIVPQGHRVGRRRLFLHGATDHLIGSSTRETNSNIDAPTIQAYTRPPTEAWTLGQLIAAGLELEEVVKMQRTFLQALDRSNRLNLETSAIDWLINDVADDQYSVRIATWMAGCARTRAIHYLPRSGCEVVIATPLYIERVPPPDADIKS